MAQTKEGAIKAAAKRAGISTAKHKRLSREGKKWCIVCRIWHMKNEFGKDRTRYDGLCAACRDGRNEKDRTYYKPRQRPKPGRRFVPPRSGDGNQARHRINYFIMMGLMQHPNALSCVDCGHQWRPGGRRHEYDHYLGYAAENHEHVQPVCSRCHHLREDKRCGKGQEPWRKGVRISSQRKKARKFCKKGHPYDGDNLLIDSGSRRCRLCTRTNERKRRHGENQD